MYYCKNCKNIIGHDYYTSKYCNYIKSNKINSINFMNCYICNKFVGILCYNVCRICFGNLELYEEKKIFDWFQKYKKIVQDYVCKICNKNKFRWQSWFFEELTFHK